MFTGIVLLILGILLVGFSFRCIFRVKKEMDDDTAGGIISCNKYISLYVQTKERKICIVWYILEGIDLQINGFLAEKFTKIKLY